LAIKSFSHKGLKNYFYDNNAKGLNPNHVKKIGFILDAIDSSHHPQDLKALYLNQFSEKKGSGEGFTVLRLMGTGG